MIIGVPKEIKNHEYRVGLTPESVEELVKDGHKVIIETSAGIGIGASDIAYEEAGASIAKNASEIFRDAKMIVKVKEPQALERKMLKQGQVLFTYLHLAPDRQQTIDLIESKAVCIAYETVTSADGSLPLLAPMSAIAGQLSLVVGSYHLLKPNKGIGTLIGSFGDIEPRVVTVIGAGVAGTEAIEKAIAANAHVKIIDLSSEKLLALKSHNFIEYLLKLFDIKVAISNI